MKQEMVEGKGVKGGGQMQEKVGFFSCLSEVGSLKKPLGWCCRVAWGKAGPHSYRLLRGCVGWKV